jgi:hypothetical protein
MPAIPGPRGPGCGPAIGPGFTWPLGWTAGAFAAGFFGGSCAIADSDSATKIDTNGTKTMKRFDVLMPETPL